jgi:hypothetical protein
MPSNTTARAIKPRLTRAEAVIFLRNNGYPLSKSYLDKRCAPGWGEGPPACAFWGRRPLYSPEQLLAWAEAKLRVVPDDVNPQAA